MLSNAGGQAGDALVLTKPLGVGAISTALKRGHGDGLLAPAVATMTTLNADAARAARGADAHAMTDVTGFGLLGHLHELTAASGLAAEVDAEAVPAHRGRRGAAARGRRGLRRQPAQPRARRDVHALRAPTWRSGAGG